MFLARVMSADFALLLKCPFITRITRKQGGQGSRHAALQVTVTKSSKSKLQVLSAGNYRKRTPKKAQAVHGPPLSPSHSSWDLHHTGEPVTELLSPVCHQCSNQ